MALLAVTLLGACSTFRSPAAGLDSPPPSAEAVETQAAPIFVGFGMARDSASDQRFQGDGPLEDLYYVSLRLRPELNQDILRRENTPGITAWVKETFASEARHAGVDIDLQVADVDIPTQPIFLLEYDTGTQKWRSDLNDSIQTPWVPVQADTEIRFQTHFTWSRSHQSSIAKDVSNTVMSLAGLNTGTWLISEVAKTYLQKTTSEVNRIMGAVTESSGSTLVTGKITPASDRLKSFTYAFSDQDGTKIGTVRFDVLLRRTLKSAATVATLKPRAAALPVAVRGTSLLEEMQIKGRGNQTLVQALNADGLLRGLFDPGADIDAIYRDCQRAMGQLSAQYGLNRPDRLMVMHQLSRRRNLPHGRYMRCFADDLPDMQAMRLKPPQSPNSGAQDVDLDADSDGNGSDAMAKFGSALKAFDKAKGFQLEYQRLLSDPVLLEYAPGSPVESAVNQADFMQLPPMEALRNLSRMNVATFCCYRNVVDAQGNEIKDRGEAALFRPIGASDIYRIEFLQHAAGAPVSHIKVAPVPETTVTASQLERLRQRADTDHPRRNEDIY